MAEFKERFLREARLAGKLQHPNIVTIHDYGEIGDDSCFIALELLRGRTLHDMLGAGPLPVRTALPIFTQLCQALVHAHEHGILHRDIKPSNVFVSESHFVKLFDFGLVKPETPHDEITDAGTFMGTPHYAAPEQIRGAACDGRIDLYAMGVLMYRTLTGRLPFRGASWVTVVLQHLEEPVPPIASVSETTIPPEVAALVERCLHKEADRRFDGGADLLLALEAATQALHRAGAARDVPVGAPTRGGGVALDPEPTNDDGTLETGDFAPLGPMRTPVPVPRRAEWSSGPPPALFALGCLAVGLVVLLAFAIAPRPAAPPPVAASLTAPLAAPTIPAGGVVAPTRAPPPVPRIEPAAPSLETSPPDPTPTRGSVVRSATRPLAVPVVDATIATSRTPVVADAAEWSGVWRGRARGRAVAFDLAVAADGTLAGKLERRIGDVTQTHRVQGTVTPSGDLRILDPDERAGTIYLGSIAGKVASGDVLSDGKTRGRWSVALE
jgi:serine/threonine-protein kinase